MSAPTSSRGILRVARSSFTCVPCGNNDNDNDDDDLATSSSPATSSDSSAPVHSLGDVHAGTHAATQSSSHVSDSAECTSKQQHPPPIGTNNNVGEVMAKAKKAAASLWMILHAQNCRMHKCSHRGCGETRLLLLHVKSCSVGSVTHPCPTCVRGCHETRRLLAHYRRCKDIRTKQVGLGRRSLVQPDHPRGSSSTSTSFCLVCSLVARYAKGILERTSNSGGCITQGKGSSLLSSSLDGKFNIERGLSHFDNHQALRLFPRIERTNPSMTLMPPPPPRYGSCPSEPSQLTVTTHPSSQPRALSDSSSILLDKCVDASVGRKTYPILRRPREQMELDSDHELMLPGSDLSFSRRLRAGSYDERQTTRVKFDPGIVDHCDMQTGEDDWRGRPRSASCSNSNGNRSIASSSKCEVIIEESLTDNEELMFTMDL